MQSINSDIRVAWLDVVPNAKPAAYLKDKTMDEDMQIEWGPAHLRDEVPAFVFDGAERPDDN
jgi:hypothetical protein